LCITNMQAHTCAGQNTPPSILMISVRDTRSDPGNRRPPHDTHGPRCKSSDERIDAQRPLSDSGLFRPPCRLVHVAVSEGSNPPDRRVEDVSRNTFQEPNLVVSSPERLSSLYASRETGEKIVPVRNHPRRMDSVPESGYGSPWERIGRPHPPSLMPVCFQIAAIRSPPAAPHPVSSSPATWHASASSTQDCSDLFEPFETDHRVAPWAKRHPRLRSARSRTQETETSTFRLA